MLGIRTSLRVPICGLVCFVTLATIHAPPVWSNESTIMISGAREPGIYHSLVNHFDTVDCRDCEVKVRFRHCKSAGSIQNLQRLGMKPLGNQSQAGDQSGEGQPNDAEECASEVNFALVQNYFAFHATLGGGLEGYQSFDTLRTVLPIYNGYVQVVAAIEDGEVTPKLRDLAGKNIYLGPSPRSVNRHHGEAVFSRHPSLQRTRPTYWCDKGEPGICETLTIDENVQKLIKSKKAGLTKQDILLGCGLIDAYVSSGAVKERRMLELECGGEKKKSTRVQVPIDEIIIDKLTDERPYYRKSEVHPSLKPTFNAPMPTITVYLVTERDAPSDLVEQVTTSLYKRWSDLRLTVSEVDLAPIKDNVLRQPAPLHAGAMLALENENVLGDASLSWQAALGLLTVGLVLIIPRVSYDRMGIRRKQKRHVLQFLAWGSLLGKLIVVIAGTIIVMITALQIILTLEEGEALRQNVDNPLLQFGFLEAVAWIFTFIASGYENNVFPLSNIARVAVALLAFVGLGLPVWFLLKVISEHSERTLDKDRGHHDYYNLSNHTLVCGWNSKAPGLIYTLTCITSPHRNKVLIVADTDAEQPIKQWRFNKRRVKFCRGDASTGRVLQRAKAEKAGAAIVLANEDEDDDQSSVLTALAVRELNEEAFIAAELGRQGTKDYIADLDINLVDPAQIARIALTLACRDKHVLDFAMDALTPDEESEWYSMSAKKIESLLRAERRANTVREAIESLSTFNINLIGITHSQGDGDVLPSQANAISSPDALAKPIESGSYLVLAASSNWSFRLARTRHALRKLTGVGLTRERALVTTEAQSLLPEAKPVPRILIIGAENDVSQLGKFVERSTGRAVNTLVVSGNESPKDIQAKLTSQPDGSEWTHVIVMALRPDGSDANQSKIDAQTHLRTHLVETALNQQGLFPRVVAEILNVDNRKLFGGQKYNQRIAVPTSLIVERVLARLASGRGYVSMMVAALLDSSDGVHLTSHRLPEKHELVGRNFNDVLTTYFDDGRVVGVLPKSEEDNLANEYDDFQTHFIMCPTRNPLILAAGDLVIVLRYRSGVEEDISVPAASE